MYFNDRSANFRRFTSVAAMGFLLWTLSFSTFLNATATLVEKKLNALKEIKDRTAEQLNLAASHIMR